MDIAYDRIQEEALSPDEIAEKERTSNGEEQQSLNTEFAQAYKAFSSSPWGAKFGAFVGNVKKQGETYYEGARQEYTAASSEAAKGLTEIMNRTRSLSLTQPDGSSSSQTSTNQAEKEKDASTSNATSSKDSGNSDTDTIRDSEGMLSRFRSEAFKRLKDIEKAEEAADEALLKFGTNMRDFLRDAVTIAPPAEGEGKDKDGRNKILFESKDQDGKRVIHSTRFDAQLHVIHSSPDRFEKDPVSPEYASWADTFSVESKTDDIAHDLEKYKELRKSMETLVPGTVKYDDFWRRYYFLRHVIESEEQRRKELLKGAAAENHEDIAWDEDSDTSAPSSPKLGPNDVSSSNVQPVTVPSTDSSTTLNATAADPTPESTLKPTDSRKSNDQNSQPDSDASYDVVSGAPSAAPSHAPGSPRRGSKKAEGGDSDEEDWE
ncbi:MAG: hypothetical protein M1837_001600 [Sclerophora amabilis]|nr:MAG: hypothetical protein M1837_001600 [Sclerophora amabilis]